MNVYRVSRWDSDSCGIFKLTRALAVDYAKRHHLHKSGTGFLDLIEVPTNAQIIVDLMNGDLDDVLASHGTVKKSWEFTPRGGLKEVPVENPKP